MLDIVPARLPHVGPISSRIRDIDRIECEAMGHSVKHALRNGVLNSDKAWTALVDGKPEAMFGVIVMSAIGGVGSPWMLGTDEIYSHGRDLLRFGPYFVAQAVDSTPRLSNIVSAANSKAIRLLRAWGFEVGQDEVSVGGVPFVQFRMTR